MQSIFITIFLALVFVLVLGIIWVCIHLLAQYRLGERGRKACEIAGDTPEHCCQHIEHCPEEIRNKCKHTDIK